MGLRRPPTTYRPEEADHCAAGRSAAVCVGSQKTMSVSLLRGPCRAILAGSASLKADGVRLDALNEGDFSRSMLRQIRPFDPACLARQPRARACPRSLSRRRPRVQACAPLHEFLPSNLASAVADVLPRSP